MPMKSFIYKFQLFESFWVIYCKGCGFDFFRVIPKNQIIKSKIDQIIIFNYRWADRFWNLEFSV